MVDETALLPPLWGIVASYADRVEQIMLAELAVFAPHIKPWDDCDESDGAGGPFDEALGESGHVAVAQWCLHQERFSQLNWISVRNTAISGGHIELVQWLTTYKNPEHRHANVRASPGDMPALSESDAVLLFAAEAGQIAMIAFLQEHGCVCNGTTALGAAGHSLETLQAVNVTTRRWPRGMYGMAASSGDVRTIEYIANEGYPDPGKYCILEALENAETPQMLHTLVEYLPAPLDATRVCLTYAERGDVEMLKAARSFGFAWSISATDNASYIGNWDALMWLINNGCPWDESARKYVAREAHADNPPTPAVVAWLAATAGSTGTAASSTGATRRLS